MPDGVNVYLDNVGARSSMLCWKRLARGRELCLRSGVPIQRDWTWRGPRTICLCSSSRVNVGFVCLGTLDAMSPS